MILSEALEKRRQLLRWAKDFRTRADRARGRAGGNIDKFQFLFTSVAVDAHSGTYGHSSVSSEVYSSDLPRLLAAVNLLRDQIIEKAVALAEAEAAKLTQEALGDIDKAQVELRAAMGEDGNGCG